MISRILVIDDDAGVLETVTAVLGELGFAVATPTDGREGLRRFHAEPFDLVITDLIMPNIDGIEAIIAIRRSRPQIPIIAITGGGRTHNLSLLDFAEKLGADSVLAKPFTLEQLVAAIATLL